MEENFKDMTNDVTEFKKLVKEFINKYDVKYLGIDIFENSGTVNIEGKTVKDITLSIEI